MTARTLAALVGEPARAARPVQAGQRDFRETSSSAFQKWSRQVQFAHVLSCQPLAMHLTFQQLPIKAVAQLRQAVRRGQTRPLPEFHFNSTSLPWRIRAGMRWKFAQPPQSSAEFLEALRAAQQEQNVVEATSQHVSSSVSIHTLMAQRSRYAQRAMHATMAPDAVDCTGIILAKLDGTAKGGVVVAIRQKMGIPVKYVGVGEQIDDLQIFDPTSFVDALLEQ